MHRSEIREATPCADCGAQIVPGRERGFAFGTGGALCWSCALRRGGAYDEALDRWTTDPDLEGCLAEED